MPPTKRNPHQNELYFPARLREKLAMATLARGIVIEAPSGYGKTTVAQDFLRDALPGNAVWMRHVCAEESPGAAWRRLCRALGRIDAPAGEALLRLGPPDADTLGDAETLLREIECQTPVWLLVDDFHRIADLAPVSLWRALLEHDAPSLHVVLAGRPMGASVMPYEKTGFLLLGENDLRLTERECGEYFALAGYPLGWEEAHALHRRAEGWMIALVLHLRHYRDHGELAPAATLDGLLREVVWNELSGAAQDSLLRLSLFDAFATEQAAFLTGRPEPGGESPPPLADALARSAFIRFDPATGLHRPHSALLDFMRGEFAALPESAQRQALHAAGDWCAMNGERQKAAAFYYRLRDFEKILALDLSGLEDNRLMDLPDLAYVDALRDIAAHCTAEMKARHPQSAIQLAFEFFGQGCGDDFAALCAEMETIVERSALPQKEKDRLAGELLLMQAFTRYNSIAEMGKRIRRAARLMGGATSLISPKNSWTFGNTSVLLMYHRDAGRLDEELADMETYAPYYAALSGGHGNGGPALMRAEACLCRGEAEAAEILLHQARHEAGLAAQTSILIGAERLAGELALQRGDGAAGSVFAAALEAIDALAGENPQKSNRMEADMARARLMALIERPQDAAAWLREGPAAAFPHRVFLQALPCAHLCRAACLLLDGKPENLLGEAPAALGLAGALHTVLALLHGHLQIAAAQSMLGKREAALAALRAALELALPDRLLLPFAEGYAPLAPLLEELRPAGLSNIRLLAERLAAGRLAVTRKLYGENHPFGLSSREHATARLAAQGFSNPVIAKRLSVTVNTVKAHLKSAYRKSRAQSRLDLCRLLAEDDRMKPP
ncbi:MAG: LuxR C-terminal-related transcriptional regulator [Azoarcus sp.]|jgi:LuxR family maltose regulon positive regulatory protein|nr:LuxR C-terminal-related transcriptional regulator [Azoarcus sp.]